MKIKFTHDFQGKLTQERWYVEGTEIEIDDEIAKELIALNHAVAVDVAPVTKAAKSVPVPATEPPAEPGGETEPEKPRARSKSKPKA